eukprot:gene9278-10991_t
MIELSSGEGVFDEDEEESGMTTYITVNTATLQTDMRVLHTHQSVDDMRPHGEYRQRTECVAGIPGASVDIPEAQAAGEVELYSTVFHKCDDLTIHAGDTQDSEEWQHQQRLQKLANYVQQLTHLQGDYQLQHDAGLKRGSAGVVCFAVDTRSRTRVAIKFFLESRQYIEELANYHACAGPNIVRVLRGFGPACEELQAAASASVAPDADPAREGDTSV